MRRVSGQNVEQAGAKTPLLSWFSGPYMGRDKDITCKGMKGVKNETANSNNHTCNNRNRPRRMRFHLPPPRLPPRSRPWCSYRHTAATRAPAAQIPAWPRSPPRQARPQVLTRVSYITQRIEGWSFGAKWRDL